MSAPETATEAIPTGLQDVAADALPAAAAPDGIDGIAGKTTEKTQVIVEVTRDRDESGQDVKIALEHPDTVPGLIAFLNALNHGSRAILTPKNLAYLKVFLTDVVEERNRRAEEIQSPEIAKAAALANAYFPLTPYAIMCIDGRVTITYRWGMFGGMKAGSVQIPAGDSTTDFLRDEKTGELFLDPSSKLARTISDAQDRPGTGSIVELLDSHTHCAARKDSEKKVGRPIKDDGLMQDVIRKKDMAQAMRDFGKKKQGKGVMPIQGSFDPHTGFAYVGLESDQALEYAKKHGGFTEAVLGQLIADGVILSSKSLAEEFNEDFEVAWKSFETEFSWETNYKKTALQLWTEITKMSSKLLPLVEKKIQDVYSLTKGQELDMRARLLLASAFNSFCNTHVSSSNPDGKYHAAEHQESFISVTRRDFGPFEKYMGFRVSEDIERLPEMVTFAAGIVRTNRAKGRVKKPDQYRTKAEFIAAPVGTFVKELLVDPKITAQHWESFTKLDWSFLEQIDWMTLSDRDFQAALQGKNPDIIVPTALSVAILNLREKMKALYNPADASANMLVEGNIVAVPIITDGNRRLRVVVPFFKRGYTRT